MDYDKIEKKKLTLDINESLLYLADTKKHLLFYNKYKLPYSVKYEVDYQIFTLRLNQHGKHCFIASHIFSQFK